MLRVALLLALALASAACQTAAPEPFPDTGVSLAQNDGPFLFILSLDPAEPGANRARVAVRDPLGKPVAARAVRVGDTPLARNGDAFSGTLSLPTGRTRLEVRADLGPEGSRRVAFELEIPAARAPRLLDEVDAAMNALRSARETNVLGIGGPPVVTRLEYAAPDRMRLVVEPPDGAPRESIFVGEDRFDREGSGAWTRSDTRIPIRWPNFAYAKEATRVRVVGREAVDGADALVVAYLARGIEAYFRLWVGVADRRVRRYVMMARGHYMNGSFEGLDAPVSIPAP